MKRLMVLMAAAFFVLALSACGGGGGGGDDAPQVTPLDANDVSTATGTYNVLYLDIYYPDNTFFSTDDLDQFSGRMTIDVSRNWSTYKIEWHDSVYGDFSDYAESAIDDSGDVTFDNAYFSLDGKYDLIFYYDNLCTDGICANAEMKIRKTSDSVISLLSVASVASATIVEDKASEHIKTIEESITDVSKIFE